jgi:CO dehydrogenase nickel-insertion accessory protein CooC1
MEHYIVKETGAYCYHTIVDENCDLSFLYQSNLKLKGKIEISFFTDKNKNHESKFVDYADLENELKTKDVFMIQTNEKDFEISFSGAEIHIYSNSKEKAEKIFKLLIQN